MPIDVSYVGVSVIILYELFCERCYPNILVYEYV